LRNAVAQFDDFNEQTRKPKAPRKTRGTAGKKKAAGRGKKGKPRYLHYAAIGLSASLVVGIMINALALQHSRHPAPLFGKAIQLGAQPTPPAPTIESVVAALPPQPIVAPANLVPAPTNIAPSMPAPIQRPHHAAPEAAVPAAKVKQDDAIAKLLKTSTTPAAAEKSQAKAAEKENPKTVLAVQHALMKLGFVVKQTGTFGPTTKAALEAFERDQRLPVNGEMSRKILKQLSAESGVAID
jgi:hypothetical protein